MLIEVDVDGHRAGVHVESPLLVEIGTRLQSGGADVLGVMSHAGSSYACSTSAALVRIAEQERARSVLAAERLRAAGLRCEVVSVGSTPTALSAQQLDGVTEVRAGVYVFFDLVMAGTTVCGLDEIALSVLTTVIGHQPERGWIMIDAGWMALSRDRGTQEQAVDRGYGMVCDAAGTVLDGWTVSGANQEHGHGGVHAGGRARRYREGVSDRHAPAHPAQPCLRDRGAAWQLPRIARRGCKPELAALHGLVTHPSRNRSATACTVARFVSRPARPIA